jgi:hypothetical protein
VPKRAETFAGFDSQFDVPKGKNYLHSNMFNEIKNVVVFIKSRQQKYYVNNEFLSYVYLLKFLSYVIKDR